MDTEAILDRINQIRWQLKDNPGQVPDADILWLVETVRSLLNEAVHTHNLMAQMVEQTADITLKIEALMGRKGV